MRLIDADEFKKYAYKEMDICAGDLICMIDEQTTAYDIDKVLSELRKCKLNEQDAWNGLDDECAFGGMTAYSHAIEIVKGGAE